MKTGPKLIIVESPAKIKTISKFLGKDFNIVSTFGHIKDLPPKKLGINIKENGKFEVDFDYTPLKDKSPVIKNICNAAKGSSEVFLASDPDREGEIISWHIGEEIKKVISKDASMSRITFNEITKPAILKAIENKSSIDMQKVEAQQARRALDRWVGFEVSPILWRKIRKGLSAGRVQSAALLLVCNREDKIINFKPEESWSIHGLFGNNKSKIDAELVRINKKTFKLKNKEETDAIVEDLKKQQYSVTDITAKTRKSKPLPPFMTSSLQQDAYNRLNFSVEKTMSTAQKLYEGLPLSNPNQPEALITYMRTDSLRLSDTALKAGREYIKNNFGPKYLPKTANQYSKSAAQDAHEAIRPINVEITPEIAKQYLPANEAKLYELIWKRFVACQMTPAEYALRQVSIEGGKYMFRITGTTLSFDGFLKVYLVEDNDDKSVKIPKEIEVGQDLILKNIDPKQHFTQPPPRYTEATLVKEMEKLGIGRPSTYAATLATILKRSYVEKEKKRYKPTELGKTVAEMLSENLPDIINLTFTAAMEEDLDKIARGEINRDKVLEIFYKKFRKDLEAFGGEAFKKKSVETDLKCPKCNNTLVIRFGKAGEFLGCSKFPECNFTSPFKRIDGKIEMINPEDTEEQIDIKCPNCGKNLVKKMGKFGPFLSCPGYPECKYIHQESLKMPCPSCGGKVVKRKWRGGSFWGCSNYPKCKFAIFGDVKEQPCPKCDSKYLLILKNKDGDVTYKCPNKECDYTVNAPSE